MTANPDMMTTSVGSAYGADSWSGAGLPLSKMEKLRSDDLDTVHAHMSAMFCPHRLAVEGGKPPLAFRHNRAVLRSVTFNATTYGNPYGRVVIGIPPMEEIYLIQISLAGEAQITYGKERYLLRQGDMCVLGPKHPIRESFDGGYKHLIVKIPRVDMENLLLKEPGFRPGELKFSPAPIRLEGQAAPFANLVRTICIDMDAGLTAYTHPRTCRAVEDTLKCLLMASVPHNHRSLFDGSISGPAPYFVRRVEDYIRAHADQPMCLSDLVTLSGVSTRSLHAGFRRFRDTTPMAYLKEYRLSLARGALQQGARLGASVTDIAFASGFTHLSKFARDYLKRYGELPSATLRGS